jgi:hypothetical protein
VIRRLVLLSAVFLGGFTALGGSAHAANGYIACVYEHDPLHVGLCVSSPV